METSYLRIGTGLSSAHIEESHTAQGKQKNRLQMQTVFIHLKQ